MPTGILQTQRLLFQKRHAHHRRQRSEFFGIRQDEEERDRSLS